MFFFCFWFSCSPSFIIYRWQQWLRNWLYDWHTWWSPLGGWWRLTLRWVRDDQAFSLFHLSISELDSTKELVQASWQDQEWWVFYSSVYFWPFLRFQDLTNRNVSFSFTVLEAQSPRWRRRQGWFFLRRGSKICSVPLPSLLAAAGNLWSSLACR